VRSGRRRLGLGVVAFGVTLAGVCASRAAVAGSASDDVDDPKMARIYQAAPTTAPPSVEQATKQEPAKATTPKASAVTPPGPPAVAAKPAVGKPETPKAEAPRQSPATAAPSKIEPPRVEAAKVEPAKPAPTKPAQVKAEGPLPAPAPVAAAPAPAPAAGGTKPTASSVDVAARPSTEQEAERPPAGRAWPYAPRLKLAYRRFPFARVGASAGTTGSASTSESFESVSVDLYPMSWYLRVGLSTQFGWESEKFDRSGDYFIAETASVGFQWPGRFTPFVEALAGAGYMRRVMADLNLPTAYWQVGVDAGVEIYLANRAYVSLAAGYLHPGNLFVMQSSLMSVKADSWSLKFGVGI
jgi:hypothetical protein